MLNFLLTLGGVVFILLFGFLKTFWEGFVYFSFAIFVALCLYWLYVLINSYITSFHKNLQERFNLYCAKLVNSTNLTMSEIVAENERYFQSFKKSLRKEKFLEICKMIVVLAILVSCVVLLFSGRLF